MDPLQGAMNSLSTAYTDDMQQGSVPTFAPAYAEYLRRKGALQQSMRTSPIGTGTPLHKTMAQQPRDTSMMDQGSPAAIDANQTLAQQTQQQPQRMTRPSQLPQAAPMPQTSQGRDVQVIRGMQTTNYHFDPRGNIQYASAPNPEGAPVGAPQLENTPVAGMKNAPKTDWHTATAPLRFQYSELSRQASQLDKHLEHSDNTGMDPKALAGLHSVSAAIHEQMTELGKRISDPFTQADYAAKVDPSVVQGVHVGEDAAQAEIALAMAGVHQPVQSGTGLPTAPQGGAHLNPNDPHGKQIAAMFLEAAGKDPNKARLLAKQHGFTF